MRGKMDTPTLLSVPLEKEREKLEKILPREIIPLRFGCGRGSAVTIPIPNFATELGAGRCPDVAVRDLP